MTLEELNEYFHLMGQLNKARELLASLEAAAAPRSPQLDGMPHTPGYGDRVGEQATKIADMRTRVAELENETVCGNIHDNPELLKEATNGQTNRS